MNHALKHWIKFIVPDGVQLAIVQFNEVAEVLSELTTVNDNTRQLLVSKLPSAATGGNCVICGLNKSMQVLSEARIVGGAIILITDADNMEQIQEFGDATPVFSFIFGEIKSNVDDLQDVPYFIQDFDAVTRTISGLSKTLLFLSLQPTSTITLFESEATGLTPLINGTFKVDPFTPKQLTLCLYSGPPDLMPITGVTLTKPDGRNVSPDVIGWHDLQIDLDDRMNGEWFINVTLIEGASKYVAVIVLARKVDQPVDSGASSWSISSKSTGLYPNMTTSVVTVRVMQGNFLVIRAKVIVDIRSEGVHDELQLFDNGCGMDDEADDGVYSRSFIYPSGKYSLHFTSSGTGHETFIGSGEKPTFVVEPMHNFISVKDMTFKKANKARLIYPPCAVRDLQVTEVTGDNEVTLSWTAPGGNIDHGRASQYFLKCSHEKEALSKTESELVKTALVSDHPGAFGHTETVNVTLPSGCERSQPVLVVIGAIGPSGLWSTRSNVVQLAALAPTCRQTPWSILLLVGVILLVGIVIVLVVAFTLKQRSRLKAIRRSETRETNTALLS